MEGKENTEDAPPPQEPPPPPEELPPPLEESPPPPEESPPPPEESPPPPEEPPPPPGEPPSSVTDLPPTQPLEVPISLTELPPAQRTTPQPEVLAPLLAELSEKPLLPLQRQSSSAEPENQTDLNVLNFDPNKPYESTLQTEVPAGKDGEKKGAGAIAGVPEFATFHCPFTKRSPFTHNPPQPEIRRTRIDHPRTPREYIINIREDLADFQESHGLPRSRDYTFVSLGLALAQETARTVCSLFLMFAELFPILAIVSLILRFALDKLIEILETNEPVLKLKKAIIFAVEMLAILIPLYILIGTIIIPLIALIFSIFKRMFRIKGKSCPGKPKPRPTCRTIDLWRFLY